MIAACFPSGISPAVMQCVIATSIDCGVHSANPGDTSSAFRQTRSYCSTVYPMRSSNAPDIATLLSTRPLTASAVSCLVVICYSFVRRLCILAVCDCRDAHNRRRGRRWPADAANSNPCRLPAAARSSRLTRHIHSGDSTHVFHDQPITSVNFNTTNTMVNRRI